MNLESNSSKKPTPIMANDDLDFDFKPITSGLGFHHNKTTEIKPVFHETPAVQLKVNNIQSRNATSANQKNDNQIYQNELSAFYGREAAQPIVEEIKPELVFRRATKNQRVFAYILDLGLVTSSVVIVLTLMSRIIEMNLVEVWSQYPNEITPLVLVLFTGFYLMYFSIFEKTTQSTLGKNILGITVVDQNNQHQSFSLLLLRSFISLVNFVSLGLFSFFELQDKVTHSKVVKVN